MFLDIQENISFKIEEIQLVEFSNIISIKITQRHIKEHKGKHLEKKLI